MPVAAEPHPGGHCGDTGAAGALQGERHAGRTLTAREGPGICAPESRGLSTSPEVLATPLASH